ncbi:MAG: hypothetical protein AB9836_11385 [Aminipila sp.]
MKILKSNKLESISKLVFVSYMIITLVISFYFNTNLIDSMESFLLYCMMGLWGVIINKIIGGKEIKWWILCWAIVSILNYVVQIIKYSSMSFLKNSVDFGLEFLVFFFVITTVALFNREKHAFVFVKVIGGIYTIELLLFSILPPNDPITLITSVVIGILLGFIPGGILFLIFKRKYSKMDKVKELLGEMQ